MTYVDGFVLPIPKKNMAEYKKMARVASRVWMDHGALQYIEAVGDDMDVPMGPGFPKGLKIRPTDTVVFAWVLYKSRAHRDRVNAKVMADPRLNESMTKAKAMPFDVKKMLYGGFKTLVSAEVKG